MLSCIFFSLLQAISIAMFLFVLGELIEFICGETFKSVSIGVHHSKAISMLVLELNSGRK